VPKKTWFQHDINCTKKEKFSVLIERGGYEAYGRFWAFAELWYSMQLHKTGHQETMNIAESVLVKQFQMNRRSLPKLLQLFGESLGIVFRNISETFPIVYETTWSKSLNYMIKRSQENDSKSKSKNKKENKDIDKDNPPPEGDSVFDSFWNEYPKKVGRGAAEKAWSKITKPKETVDLILQALSWQKISEQWTKDNGQYIPNPSTYINQRRWEDHKPEGPENKPIGFKKRTVPA